MRYVSGFGKEILDSLHSPNEEIEFHAVGAAGEWGLEKAWPHLNHLLTDQGTPRPLLMAAIYSAPGVSPQEAPAILAELTGSEDAEIADAAAEALELAEGGLGDEDEWECALCDGLEDEGCDDDVEEADGDWLVDEAAGDRDDLLGARSEAPSEPIHTVKVGRNEPCPCGSGKKSKKCCLGNR
ncbi:MAG: SEC-C domain-containing protein [Candidatus Riflebacteria bacterium]|nr:SEC-C domain-containing protein [Candidatus Riflebacteria bacterium]